ncbi:hypothetical protein ABT301_12900 [Streptomyces sp. NPDC000987]|uniref:hypothetical protein n=1 Tax=Streptomyces sp. NPDC000987 TaxID=3154374 RepID=UPI0033208CC3
MVHVRLRVSSTRTLDEVVDLEDHPSTSFQYGRAPGLGRVLVHGPHATSLHHPGSWCLIDRRGLIPHQVRLDWMDVEDPAFRGRRCREPDKVLTRELLSAVRRDEAGGQQ